MSGYFSRIAKQSGLRFSKSGERHGDPMKSRAEHMMPLDHEETVMISPGERTGESRLGSAGELIGARGAEPKQNVQNSAAPRAQSRKKSEASSTPVKSTTSQAETRGTETRPTDPAVEEVRLVEPERHRTELPAVTFSENKRDTIPPEPRGKPQKPVNDEKRQTDTANSETPDKDFFERTTEIIQGRSAEPSAVQTILIQEVQEWIAAGRIPTDDIMTDVDADRERPLPDETHSNVDRKPGVIRIGDRKPPEISSDHVQELSPPPTELNEQNFEISIGSISVVVEGEEPVPQRAPAATPTNAPSSASPRTSRLSRHYL